MFQYGEEQKKANIKKWVLDNLKIGKSMLLQKINVKLVGTFRCYGINGMLEDLLNLWKYVKYLCFKWLNRRSQRRSFKYRDFLRIWNYYIENPIKIYKINFYKFYYKKVLVSEENL